MNEVVQNKASHHNHFREGHQLHSGLLHGPVLHQRRVADAVECFERFFQVDSSQRRVYGGAGLGLALVKELAESYGGSVSVVSPGKDLGTTLTVLLPCVSA